VISRLRAPALATVALAALTALTLPVIIQLLRGASAALPLVAVSAL
jgi:hypothetical protein